LIQFFLKTTGKKINSTSLRALLETEADRALRAGVIEQVEKTAIENIVGHSSATCLNYYVMRNRLEDAGDAFAAFQKILGRLVRLEIITLTLTLTNPILTKKGGGYRRYLYKFQRRGSRASSMGSSTPGARFPEESSHGYFHKKHITLSEKVKDAYIHYKRDKVRLREIGMYFLSVLF
jgi:hypothetical protein